MKMHDSGFFAESRAVTLLAAAFLWATVSAEEWIPVPLGEPGTLKVEKTLRNEPSLRDSVPERGDGLVLFDGKRSASVVADLSSRRLYPRSRTLKMLAEEVCRHLSEMTGRDVELKDSSLAKDLPGPVVEIAELDVPSQTAVVRIEGDRVVVGGDGAGVSHAVTYFLESLGVRYLWPGKSGKVVPKKVRVVMPAVSLDKAPAFDCLRRIWAPHPNLSEGARKMLKLGAEEFSARYAECFVDSPGNRNFYEWHGFNDRLVFKTKNTKATVQDAYDGGHYFGDYYRRFSAEHPDWFALQPDGTRVNRSKHPRLCLSNEGLIREVVRDRIGFFRRHPDKPSASICLPDGDKDSVCMCEGCRRLDPVNAEPIRIRYWNPSRQYTNYVALTDRVLWFCNRVAEGVVKEFPGKKLKTFIYAAYSCPPVKVRPHPALVVFNVSGNLSSSGSIGRETECVAAFSQFGNLQVWRPNILEGFQAQVPQNYARILYNDVVRFRENGVRGVSFDECSEEFALKGFVFYMLGRALMNHDNLSYEAQLADYCSCFGAAAPEIRRYLEELEQVHVKAAEQNEGVDGLLRIYPVEELATILERAAALTKDDSGSLERVRFLQKGISVAREELKLHAGWYSGDWKLLREARKVYCDFVRKMVMDDPVALHPGKLNAKGPYLRGAPRREITGKPR